MRITSVLKVAPIVLATVAAFSAQAANEIKETYYPMVNGSPITLMKDNLITQSLGGRLLNLDVWAGEFVRYDDNIFNTSGTSAATQKESDVVWSTAAGFKLEADQANVWKARIEGQIQRNKYKDNSDYDGQEGYFHSMGSANLSDALSIRASADYDRTYDNLKDAKDIAGRDQFAFGVGTTIKPSPFMGIDADYRFYMVRRAKDTEQYQKTEYDEHSLSLRPYYELTSNTTVYMRAGLAQATPKNDLVNFNGKTDAYELSVGASWMYSDAANLYGELGYKRMEKKDVDVSLGRDSLSRPTLRVGGDITLDDAWSVGASVSYAPSYSAESTSASNSNFMETTRVGAKLQYSPGAGRLTAQATPFYTLNKPSNDVKDVKYSEYGLGLGLSYVVTDWFNFSAGYRYSVTDYDDASSYDRNVFTLGAVLTF